MVGIYKMYPRKKPNLIYIGSSINIEKREKEHMDALRLNKHSNKKLQQHYNKTKDLVLSVLLCCNESELDNIEQFFIDTYKPHFNISTIVTKRGKRLSGIKA